MQKLETRNTYTPTDASQVCGNCDYALNREQSPSVHSLKTDSNNSDVNQQSGKTEQDLRVPVLNMHGKPLMPTKPAKARHLLNQDKAKVASRKPFTIQLNYATGENRQKITLGIDAGYKYIGFSAITKKQELISGEVELRTDIPKKLLERQMYRRNRRSRKWHRPPRFDNRKRNNEWIAPSIQHKLDSHIRIVKKLKQILPITKIIVEVASFDIQKMENPEISGIEYQQGTLQGYEIRNYLLEKFNHKCVYCSKKNIPLEIEHLTPKSRGGSNRVDNLAISCHKCNQKKGNQTCEEFGYPSVRKKASKSYKDATFMNIIRWRIVDALKCEHTYGHITKHNRIKQGIEKSHLNDAFIIAGGENHNRCKPFMIKQVRRNNRSIQLNRKGFKPSIRKQRYNLQPNDRILYNNKEHIVKGVHCKGSRVIISDIAKKISVNIKKVELIIYGKGIQFLHPLK